MSQVNSVLRYFDLLSELKKRRGTKALAEAEKTLHWLPQYLALFFGVLLQPYFEHYRANQDWDLVGIWGFIPFALITAFLIFPGAYKKSFDPETPLPVQLAVITTAGMGWESLVSTVVAAAA